MTRVKLPSTTQRPYAEAPYRVVGRVHACIPEFELVYVRTADDIEYVLTPETEGVSVQDLQEGQKVDCVISGGLPRVLSAVVVW